MTRITVRVIPNASRSEIVGKENSVWKVRLAAPPVEGKANDALIDFLADVLELAPSTIAIAKGQSSKSKVVEIPLPAGMIEEALSSKI